MTDEIAIGIDLGTSYSCVALVQDGVPTVLPNEWGELTHASVVSFLEDGSVLVGNPAKRNIITNAEFTATLGKVLRRPTAIPTPLLALRVRFGAELVQHLLLDSQRVQPAKLQAAGFEFAQPELEAAISAVHADD